MSKNPYKQIVSNMQGSGRLKDGNSSLSQKLGHVVKPSQGNKHKPMTDSMARSEMQKIKGELS